MNIVINEEIAPEIARAIIAQATLRGLSVNDYLRHETATAEEWIREFTKWADSHDPNTPALPLEAVSRESIYEDR